MNSSLTWIVIKGAAPMSLEHLWFDLSSQMFMIDKVNLSWGHSAIPSLRTLELTMACRVAEQRNTLLNFLKSCTGLRELIIWRGDEATPQEECEVIGQRFSCKTEGYSLFGQTP
uniref:FBD domain-containing protein n=1 Tax=Arundo donax TaxID=35708 RepID=A0A0A8YAU0_ARUDO